MTKLFGRLFRLGELMRVEGEPKHAQVRPLNFHAKRHLRPGAAAAAGGGSAGSALYSAHKAEAAPAALGGSVAGPPAALGERGRGGRGCSVRGGRPGAGLCPLGAGAALGVDGDRNGAAPVCRRRRRALVRGPATIDVENRAEVRITLAKAGKRL